jgi:hypothetical protein
MTLARERAISRAYLVAGDEDLREAVAEAQKLGIQVVLLGMPSSVGHNQSAALVRECDQYLDLPRAVWEPHCRPRTAEDEDSAPLEVEAIQETAREFAAEWAADHLKSQRAALAEQFPKLPREVDIALLQAGEQRVGSLRRRHDLKEELRGTFWWTLRELVRREDQRPANEGSGRGA